VLYLPEASNDLEEQPGWKAVPGGPAKGWAGKTAMHGLHCCIHVPEGAQSEGGAMLDLLTHGVELCSTPCAPGVVSSRRVPTMADEGRVFGSDSPTRTAGIGLGTRTEREIIPGGEAPVHKESQKGVPTKGRRREGVPVGPTDRDSRNRPRDPGWASRQRRGRVFLSVPPTGTAG